MKKKEFQKSATRHIKIIIKTLNNCSTQKFIRIEELRFFASGTVGALNARSKIKYLGL